jgi:integrase
MARTIRNAKIDSRSARAKLSQRREPYWTVISAGCALGYRRPANGGSWIARGRDETGRQIYRALGGADDAMEADGQSRLTFGEAQAAARDWFARAERQAAEGMPRSSDQDTVGDVLDAYLEWFATHKKSLRDTAYTIETHIRPALGKIALRKLTAAMLRRWHDNLAQQPARLRSRADSAPHHRAPAANAEAVRARKATANRILTVLKAALNKAFHDGRVASDSAWRSVKPFRNVDAARVRYLTEDECRRLLNACPPDFRELVHGALVSGCRYGELTRLTIADFHPDSGTLLIREAKSGKPRHVPLDDGAFAFFEAITAGRPSAEPIFRTADGRTWGKSYQARPLAQACQAARIDPPITFHGLRHTWASHRVMKGAPLIVRRPGPRPCRHEDGREALRASRPQLCARRRPRHGARSRAG